MHQDRDAAEMDKKATRGQKRTKVSKGQKRTRKVSKEDRKEERQEKDRKGVKRGRKFKVLVESSISDILAAC